MINYIVCKGKTLKVQNRFVHFSDETTLYKQLYALCNSK